MTHHRGTAPHAENLSAGALRALRQLTKRRGREEQRRFLAEGPQAVREAIASGAAREVVVADGFGAEDLLTGFEGSIRLATEQQMRQLSDTVTPQGVVAVCDAVQYQLGQVAGADLVVICAQVRDPGNAGTVVRCADAFGADAVIFTHGSVELYNPKTVRSSVGSIFHLPVVTGVELPAVVEHLKGQGMQVLAADADGQPLDDLAARGGLNRPTAWLLGNEAWGLPPEMSRLADSIISVPMWGHAESLNLSTAAAVLLYQTASAQRRGKDTRVEQ